MAHARCRGQLILRSIALEDLADFEQRRVHEAAIAIGLHGGDQTGQQARPHVGQVGSDGVGKRKFARSAAEQFGRRS